MLILKAESKTMDDREFPVGQDIFESNKPAGEEQASEIMAHVATLSASDIAETVKVSLPMAAKIARMAYEFPNKSMGLKAIDAYTGVVFKAFDYPSLTEKEKALQGAKGWQRLANTASRQTKNLSRTVAKRYHNSRYSTAIRTVDTHF